MAKKINEVEYFTEYDAYLFHGGEHFSLYQKMGAHICKRGKEKGTMFTLWAPKAKEVSVLTDGNGWNPTSDYMNRSDNGVWELFIPGACEGTLYKYSVLGADGIRREKADPFAFRAELRPKTASVVCPLDSYTWHDRKYMNHRSNKDVLDKPMSVYEVHLGSWKKDFGRGEDGFLNYRELAPLLSEYVEFMGYTHVELMGICEHPFDGSWGYQVTGYFAPTSRYGTPDDFRFLVDHLHQHGIGVIIDWVPAHFPKDAFGLEMFDGTPAYEYEDPLRAEFPEWGTKAFDHGKHEVQCFLISSAVYLIKEFHADALRVDAVASLFYNNFSRSEWRPNIYGGNDNLEGMGFLRKLNHAVKNQTDGYLIAEDSSVVGGVTKGEDYGGFGFMLKWNMGWMNDTLKYVGKDPIYRGWHHGEITHIIDYAFSENFCLVLSHDEVVHLKHSMLEKFPGSLQDKLGGLKTLYTNMMTFPGKKLLFMGQEFAEDREWDEKREINWGLASDMGHRDVMLCYRDLLKLYRKYPCLYSDSMNPTTFEWVNASDAYRSTFSFIRRNPWNYEGALLVICNYSPCRYDFYSCGIPEAGLYKRVFSTYDNLPGEGGPGEVGDIVPLEAANEACDGYEYRITYNLRPYESVIFELPSKPKKRKNRSEAKENN